MVNPFRVLQSTSRTHTKDNKDARDIGGAAFDCPNACAGMGRATLFPKKVSGGIFQF